MSPQPRPLVLYHGRNDLDHTIILSVRAQRYEYFLTPQQCETVEQLCRKGLPRRALNYAKARAHRVVKIREACTSSTTTSG